MTISAQAGGTASPTASPTRQAVRRPVSASNWIVTPDGSAFVCGAIAFTGIPPRQIGETGFLKYSMASGKVP